VRSLFLFAVLTWMTGNPILALVLVLLVSAVTYGYLTARLFRVPRAIHRWRAIRELGRAVALNPHDASAQADLGRLLVDAGDPARALSHLEIAHTRAPEVAETTYYLGAARLRLGNEASGRPLVEEALARDPRLGFVEPHLRLGVFFLELDHPDVALVHL
jgi:tetratricopeptide (TPR) repeat protein